MAEKLEILDDSSGNALKWLLELEQVTNPHFNHALILNIFKIHKSIKDAQVITDSNHKRMLVFLELSWFGNRFKKRGIQEQVLNMLNEILPSYNFRIVFNLEVFQKALGLINGN